MNEDGRLIVIEGIDGAGKSTVSKELCQRHSCYYMKQPEDSWVGEAARRALKEEVEPACDLFLHMAAHANQQSALRSNIKDTDVVMDRYYHSRVAYQSVQTQFSADEIQEMHSGWSIEPSVVVILDLTPNEALNRKYDGNDKFENIEFLTDVRSVYQNYYRDREDVVYIDASKPREEVISDVESEVFD